MGNRLDSFLQDKFGIHTRHRECPVAARIGNQRLRGTIDLLIETEDCFHIFDHKSFPGAAASNKHIGLLAIHMPIVGKIILFRTSTGS